MDDREFNLEILGSIIIQEIKRLFRSESPEDKSRLKTLKKTYDLTERDLKRLLDLDGRNGLFS